MLVKSMEIHFGWLFWHPRPVLRMPDAPNKPPDASIHLPNLKHGSKSLGINHGGEEVTTMYPNPASHIYIYIYILYYTSVDPKYYIFGIRISRVLLGFNHHYIGSNRSLMILVCLLDSGEAGFICALAWIICFFSGKQCFCKNPFIRLHMCNRM